MCEKPHSLWAHRWAPAFGSWHHPGVSTEINSTQCNSWHIFAPLSSFLPPLSCFLLLFICLFLFLYLFHSLCVVLHVVSNKGRMRPLNLEPVLFLSSLQRNNRRGVAPTVQHLLYINPPPWKWTFLFLQQSSSVFFSSHFSAFSSQSSPPQAVQYYPPTSFWTCLLEPPQPHFLLFRSPLFTSWAICSAKRQINKKTRLASDGTRRRC